MLWRITVCFAVLAATAFAGWNRSVTTEKHHFTDSPPSHPLAYFETDPCLRPDSDRLVGSLDECGKWVGAPPDAAEIERRANTTTEMVELGEIGEFTIYDLWYARFQHGRDLRSVLIKTGSDEYREVNVNNCGSPTYPASEVADLDGEKMLIVEYQDGGQNNNITKTPYVLRPSGLEPPDFSAVGKAINDLIPPKNMSVRHWNDDYSAMKVVIEFYRNDTNQPPVMVVDRGCITVTYCYFQGHAVVTGSNYEPLACRP
jgi:hypothetical protein